MGLKAFKFLSTHLCKFHLGRLGHSQNSMWLSCPYVKNCFSSVRVAEVWIWYRWDLLLKIFLAAWIESVMTMILEMLSLLQAWLIPHLIANSFTSVLVMKAAWWTVLTKGWLRMWICKIEVAISFLMLASETTIAVWGDVDTWIVMLSNCWEHDEAFFPLVAKLKENLSGKMSITLECYKTRVWIDFG